MDTTAKPEKPSKSPTPKVMAMNLTVNPQASSRDGAFNAPTKPIDQASATRWHSPKEDLHHILFSSDWAQYIRREIEAWRKLELPIPPHSQLDAIQNTLCMMPPVTLWRRRFYQELYFHLSDPGIKETACAEPEEWWELFHCRWLRAVVWGWVRQGIRPEGIAAARGREKPSAGDVYDAAMCKAREIFLKQDYRKGLRDAEKILRRVEQRREQARTKDLPIRMAMRAAWQKQVQEESCASIAEMIMPTPRRDALLGSRGATGVESVVLGRAALSGREHKAESNAARNAAVMTARATRWHEENAASSGSSSITDSESDHSDYTEYEIGGHEET
jgi:hypothetical protein